MLSVVCINAGNYLGLGHTYTNNLRRAVSRNLTLDHRFVCFTDAAKEGYIHGIEVRPLPGKEHPISGWWHKVALFKAGVFEDGERIVFLDLDSVITGSLDDIASYDGEFAMLQDVMFRGLRASGVMAWRGGFGSFLWDDYVAAGYPQNIQHPGYNFGGDGAWIGRNVDGIDLLQDLYPNQIASYKMTGGILAPYTRIVAFHGVPRPHEVTTGWVPKLWNHVARRGA